MDINLTFRLVIARKAPVLEIAEHLAVLWLPIQRELTTEPSGIGPVAKPELELRLCFLSGGDHESTRNASEESQYAILDVVVKLVATTTSSGLLTMFRLRRKVVKA